MGIYDSAKKVNIINKPVTKKDFVEALSDIFNTKLTIKDVFGNEKASSSGRANINDVFPTGVPT